MKKYFKKLWCYIYSSVQSGKAPAACFSILLVLLIISLSASVFISPKPWYQQAFYTIAGLFSGSVLGAVAGLIIGGIGIALAGTALGIAGWVAGAIFGATLGGLFGVITSFIANPSLYNLYVGRFFVILVLATLIGWVFYRIMLKIFRKFRNNPS
ncbi:hypothetical protein [Methylophaga thiooxydans]|uniref:hypothetical protein n=1 Tax=Methylophaga thiooxydans TaxID=392484 RepID=UPI0023566D50|nr:hypothetical protein [Methylophaga thiooxydans]